MSSRANYISEDDLLRTTYSMLALTSVFILARVVTTQVLRPTRWLPQDGIIYLAYAMYMVMMIMYILVIPILFRLTNVSKGKLKPYPKLREEHRFMVHVFFVNTILLWFILWSIKFSFLVLYRKLVKGLYNIYNILWWAIGVFCFLSLVGCVVSHITSCSSMTAWFTPGACQTPRDVHAQIASLYFTYAVDVVTDLMIMALPIGLVWNLQMPRSEKAGIVTLFGVGVILIIVATLRVIQIGTRAQNKNQPSASWLALWGIVECSIAIIIGCCPAFASFVRNRTTPNLANDMPRFVHQREVAGLAEPETPSSVKLHSIAGVRQTTSASSDTEARWEDCNESQRELVNGGRDLVEEVVVETPHGTRRTRVRKGA